LSLDLKPTRDILKWAGRHKRQSQRVVGFALEDVDIFANAERKLKTKKLDMIVANAPAAIGAERSTLHIKTKTTDWQTLSNQTKPASAKKLLSLITTL
jgi:phosphopantothenoylcysteine decarboxylase/phosphopantothenate--cysteine ligase